MEPSPKDLPEGWEEVIAVPTARGAQGPCKMYHSFKDDIIQQSDPRPPPDEESELPGGWTLAYDADGDVYYTDHNSGQSRLYPWLVLPSLEC